MQYGFCWGGSRAPVPGCMIDHVSLRHSVVPDEQKVRLCVHSAFKWKCVGASDLDNNTCTVMYHLHYAG